MYGFKFFIALIIVSSFLGRTSVKANSRQNSKKSKKLFDVALQYYNSSNYIEAEKYSISSINADTLNIQSYLLLSDISDEIRKTSQRVWALEKVFMIDSLSFPLVHKFLASLYFNEGSYSKSLKKWLSYQGFNVHKDSILIVQKIEECEKAVNLKMNPYPIQIEHLSSKINTSENEYWPLITADDSTLFFTRLIRERDAFAFERLFFSDKTEEDWEHAKQLILNNSEEINIGTISLTANGNMLFYTACGRSDGMGSCDIYYMKKENGFWQRPTNAGAILNSRYWEAQPSISASGEVLYFSSNRTGGFGKKDIWMSRVSITSENRLNFSQAINLGATINSSGSDYSPFIHADDRTLYFASDGRFGLGNSDLYFSQLNDSIWSNAINMGSPINSRYSDDGLVVSPTALTVVFSSNREESINQSKDIYKAELPNEFLPDKVGYMKGKVFDKMTTKPLSVDLKLINLTNNSSYVIQSDIENGYITILKANQTYALSVAKKGYLFYSEHINYSELGRFNSALQKHIYLAPIVVNASMVLKNIFFDSDSYQLKSVSFAELDQLIKFMKINQNVIIELAGHTDNIGTADYNLNLSEKRAETIRQYLSKSIPNSRISTIGYGDTKPIESNENEKGRSKNRRTELRIVGN
ncbi:MAG: OmpA family protein [Prolixibacteraceae bacterium]|jgi:outer membrane protein OmpA-like peptidoglycan-associated protein|nr:OmpA family protein [Prolixibacteraceae bacterium]